jgi:hypothetical protein
VGFLPVASIAADQAYVDREVVLVRQAEAGTGKKRLPPRTI